MEAAEGRRGGSGRGELASFWAWDLLDEAAAKKGEPLYKQNCGTCHGDNARLAGSKPGPFRGCTARRKREEIAGDQNGRPQGGMPGFPALSQDDLYNISQYLHLQVELAANRGTYGTTYGALRNGVSGMPQSAAFFNGSGGCAKCHSVSGDLAKIGAKFPRHRPCNPVTCGANARTRQSESHAGFG